MKFIFALIYLGFFFSLAACQDEQVTDSNGNLIIENTDSSGYLLVWSDDFEGSVIDTNKWEHEVNAEGGGNNELQYYTSRGYNSFVENGNLNIVARNEVYSADEGTRNFTSARMRTKYKGDWKYGRFEIKAKLPFGKGIWPAIWMLPTDWEYGGWAASGEIDIMEQLGHEPEKIYGTIHYGGSWPENKHHGGNYSLENSDFSDDFHIFSIEWEAEEIRWYIDGKLYYTTSEWFSSAAEYPAPFNKRFHIILNVAVGGKWPGNPDESTVFPQTMQVDWVKVYQKK